MPGRRAQACAVLRGALATTTGAVGGALLQWTAAVAASASASSRCRMVFGVYSPIPG